MKTSTVHPMTLEEAEREAVNHRGELVAMTRAGRGLSFCEVLRRAVADSGEPQRESGGRGSRLRRRFRRG